MIHRIRLEQLLGRNVVDVHGAKAGRIEEIRCAPGRDNTIVVTEFLLGKRGLRERLSISGLSLTFTGLLGASTAQASHRVRWDQIDLSDPKHPRLQIARDELEAV